VSKAFTREDDAREPPPPRRRGALVPMPNFVTAAGITRLRAELETTRDPDRAHELAEHLATAEPVPPQPGVVGFGATVTLSDGRTFRIVGAIEAAPKEGAISWESPIAAALLGARVGDTVVLPRGEVDVEAIAYDEAP